MHVTLVIRKIPQTPLCKACQKFCTRVLKQLGNSHLSIQGSKLSCHVGRDIHLIIIEASVIVTGASWLQLTATVTRLHAAVSAAAVKTATAMAVVLASTTATTCASAAQTICRCWQWQEWWCGRRSIAASQGHCCQLLECSSELL